MKKWMTKFMENTMVFLPATAPQRMDDMTTGNGKKHPK
jgi:hypothetical protein